MENLKKPKQLVYIREAASIFGIGERRLRQLAESDSTIPKIYVGKYIKINTALMREWINQATKEGKVI